MRRRFRPRWLALRVALDIGPLQGYEVDIYDQRPFIGGKVASYKASAGLTRLGGAGSGGGCSPNHTQRGRQHRLRCIRSGASSDLRVLRHLTGPSCSCGSTSLCLPATCRTRTATTLRWGCTSSSAATSTSSASWPSAACWRTCCSRWVGAGGGEGCQADWRGCVGVGCSNAGCWKTCCSRGACWSNGVESECLYVEVQLIRGAKESAAPSWWAGGQEERVCWNVCGFGGVA